MNDLSHRALDEIDIHSIGDSLVELMQSDLQKPNGIFFEEIGDKVKLIEAKLMARAKEVAKLHSCLVKQSRHTQAIAPIIQEKVLPLVLDDLHQQFSEPLLYSSLSSGKVASISGSEETLTTLLARASEKADAILSDTSGNGIVSQAEMESKVQSALHEAVPDLLQFGGKQRILLIGDDQSHLASLKSIIEDITGFEISVSVVDGAETILVHEGSEIPIEAMLGKLVGTLKADLSVAGRLMTRCDISWAEPLESSTTASTSGFFDLKQIADD